MTKRAVCIGINDYPGTYNDLSGCVNDANDWADLLRGDFGFGDNIQLITDTDATLEKAVSKGATAVMPPMDTPYGRAAGLIDPWGAGFNIIDRSSATA